MSEINSQALREAAVAIETVATPQKLLAFRMKVTPQVVLALLDELERNQQYIKSRDQENEEIALTVGKLRVELEATENNLIDSECHVAELEEALRDKQALLEASEKRIAELEAREVVLPRAHDVHPLGPQSAKIFCEFHRSIVNRCADEIRKVGVKVSIKGN
ncbi:ead/Ea22-like family protein [Escherichia coli]